VQEEGGDEEKATTRKNNKEIFIAMVTGQGRKEGIKNDIK